jgi:hypothetical protein
LKVRIEPYSSSTLEKIFLGRLKSLDPKLVVRVLLFLFGLFKER